jgi:hypothetical protein
MKRTIFYLVLIVAIGGGLYLYTSQKGTIDGSDSAKNIETSEQTDKNKAPAADGENRSAKRDALINSIKGEQSSASGAGLGDDTIDDIKPAAEAYKSADEAFAAALKGSKEFNDAILEQFTEPGADCSWCPQFYALVQETVTNPNTPQDQKSYMAELLAISGRAENVQALVEGIKNAPNSNEADLFAEALELTLGKDEVTRVLGDQLSTTNDTLREASVAAITNQGTRFAAEILQKHVQERNDPDAYYSEGIGPGEFIPDEDALPFVQELVQKRDQFSPVWAKSLINAGLPGLQSLFEQLEGSTNYDSDRALIKDALSHVNYEDGIKEVVDNVLSNNRSPVAVDFAKQIQAELLQQESEDAEGTTEP